MLDFALTEAPIQLIVAGWIKVSRCCSRGVPASTLAARIFLACFGTQIVFTPYDSIDLG